MSSSRFDERTTMNLETDQLPTEQWFRGVHVGVKAVLDKDVGYKVTGFPTVNTSIRGLWRVATSNEVLRLLLMLFLLMFAIEVFASINGRPIPKVMAVAVLLSPFLVTFISWLLIAIRTQISSLFRPEIERSRIHSLPNTFFSAAILYFIAFLLPKDQVVESGSKLIGVGSSTEIASFAFFVVAYTLIAEFIHHFIFKYLVPIGSPSWIRVTQTERKPIKDWMVYRFWNDLWITTKTDHVVIGKQQVALDELVSITAQGNYVQVSCVSSDYFERVPLSKAVQVLPSEFGLMLHRSNWVAHGAIESYSRYCDECVVKLTNGTLVSVARSRVKDVARLLSNIGVEKVDYCDLK